MNKRIQCAVIGILVAISIIACDTNKEVAWQEEVKLNNGNIAIIHRTQEYIPVGTPGLHQSWLFKKATIKVVGKNSNLPEFSWEGQALPLSIEASEAGDLYLVVVVVTTEGQLFYSSGNTPHIAFVKRAGRKQWEKLSLNDIPSDMNRNLFAATDAIFVENKFEARTYIDLKYKEMIDNNTNLYVDLRGWKSSDKHEQR